MLLVMLILLTQHHDDLSHLLGRVMLSFWHDTYADSIVLLRNISVPSHHSFDRYLFSLGLCPYYIISYNKQGSFQMIIKIITMDQGLSEKVMYYGKSKICKKKCIYAFIKWPISVFNHEPCGMGMTPPVRVSTLVVDNMM